MLHLKGQTDDVPKIQYQGWFIFTHSTIPIGIYAKLQITESSFPHENIDKNIDIRALFPTNYVHTFLSNTGDFFPHFNHSEALSPVFAPPAHTGRSIPVQPPLNYILKRGKQCYASSNRYPKCYKSHSTM